MSVTLQGWYFIPCRHHFRRLRRHPRYHATPIQPTTTAGNGIEPIVTWTR